jgi:hypothetical protein
MSREAMQMALEALEGVLDDAPKVLDASITGGLYEVFQCRDAITLLRQALVDANDTSQERVDEKAKREQEPVAWANSFDLQNFDMKVRTCPDLHHTVPLYTAPPKQWVGLTDAEIHDMNGYEEDRRMYRFARTIEAKLKEKNHG